VGVRNCPGICLNLDRLTMRVGSGDNYLDALPTAMQTGIRCNIVASVLEERTRRGGFGDSEHI